MNTHRKTAIGILLSATVSLTGLWAQGSGSDLKDRLILDTRVRFESVDQEWGGDGEAVTARARIGYQSEDYDGLTFLIEGEISRPLDEDDFDAYPGAAGTAGKALIPDGETTELNRAQLSYKSGDWTTVLGRQRIIIDNARFIGNVGWRQNEQTYDAATFVYKPDEQSRLIYAYVDRVQRIFGSEALASAQRKLDTKAHVLNYNYKRSESEQYGVYYYDLGVKNAAAASSRTFGGFFEGSAEIDNGWKIGTRFEYAQQSDNGTSPAGMDFSLNYFLVSGQATHEVWSGGVALEQLEGDGVVGFSTPLATLHGFNGWADVFLSTPADGLVDMYGWLEYKFDKSTSAKLVYHDFESERGSTGYGDEIDLLFVWKVNPETKLTAKYATYNGKGEAPGLLKIDRNKFWLQVDYSY